ncbi:MAG: lysylphosphatidylglycerol synthase domain-containing protein [Gemmataceae bacterium]
MSSRWHTWWPVLKTLIGLAIIVCVGWQFWKILRQKDLWQIPLTSLGPSLVLAGGLYVLGLACSAIFWFGLLRSLGQQAHLGSTLRAYYIGQLGRYVPGKAVGVVMRARLLTGEKVRGDVAAMTVVYESLTTMAAGALVASLLFTLQAWGVRRSGWQALILLAIFGILILPGVFNPLVDRLAAPFRKDNQAPLPAVHWTTLLGGLALAGCGWLIQGLGLWTVISALLPEPPMWSWAAWLHFSASLALANVAGFLIIFVPYGLGVREVFLQSLLASYLAQAISADQAAGAAVMAVLLLRLVSLVFDLLAAGIAYGIGYGRVSA